MPFAHSISCLIWVRGSLGLCFAIPLMTCCNDARLPWPTWKSISFNLAFSLLVILLASQLLNESFTIKNKFFQRCWSSLLGFQHFFPHQKPFNEVGVKWSECDSWTQEISSGSARIQGFFRCHFCPPKSFFGWCRRVRVVSSLHSGRMSFWGT